MSSDRTNSRFSVLAPFHSKSDLGHADALKIASDDGRDSENNDSGSIKENPVCS